MKRIIRLTCTVGLAIFGPLPLLPQRAADQSADPVFRISVGLVQVDAVVTDSHGRHIADLKPEDFEVLEDGRPQKITHFSYVAGGATGAPPPGLKGPEARLAFPRSLRPEDVRRTIVLVADDLSFGPDEFPRVRTLLTNFVDTQMQPGDLVSIMTTSGGMGALEQLTNDKRPLYESIARIMFSPARNQFGGSLLTNESRPQGTHYDFASDDRALAASRRPLFAAGATSAMAYAIQALETMPGRKAVALFSSGFPGSPAPLVEMANRSSVVIYAVDMRGVIAPFDARRPSGYWASQETMDVLARSTGGVFFHDTNGFGAALTTALDDMSSYYLIGYQPQRADFEQVRGKANFHWIQVKVLRPGLHVRSRDGFVGVPDAPPLPEDESGRDELQKALYSPFRGNDIPVYLGGFYSASVEEGKRAHRYQTSMRTMMLIDARGLRPGNAPGNNKKLVLDVLAGIWNANDKPISLVDKSFTIEKTADEMERDRPSGLALEIDVPVPAAGGYQLRSAVREANSGQIGSATAFVEIPDFNRGRLALSSVLLWDRDPNRAEALERAGVVGAGSPVTRVFATGAVLSCDFDVFGALIDRAAAKPRIDMEVRLFRGSERIFTGQMMPLGTENGNSLAVIHATGEIRLPPSLPPGNYSMELSVWDRLQKPQSQPASQWVDFTLVKPNQP